MVLDAELPVTVLDAELPVTVLDAELPVMFRYCVTVRTREIRWTIS